MLIHRRALCAGLGASAVVAPSNGQEPPAPPWDEIATIVVQDMNGAQVALGALAAPAGRPILLQFWATWCAPCLPESRHLAAVRARTPEAQLAMIGVNLDRDQGDERLAAFRERAGMNYTQVLGQPGLFIVATREAGLALPRAHLYDRAGRLTNIFAGFSADRSPAAIDAAVARALAT